MYTVGGELYHHGIPGQRKGVRNGPPYPLSRGAHSATEKKKKWWQSLIGGGSKEKKKRKEEAVKINEQKKQAEEEEKKKKYEEDKEKALKSGSASEVLKYQGDLTNNQLMDAITRIEREGKLKAMSKSDTKSTMDKIDDIVNKIDKYRNWAEKGINAYNTVAKISNAFSEYDDLPIIGEKHQTRSQKENEKINSQIKKLTVENSKLRNEAAKNDADTILRKNESVEKAIKKALKKEDYDAVAKLMNSWK